MEVRQRNRQWRVRWITSPETACLPHVGAASAELCARCDRSGRWIAVPDVRPLPEPSVVHVCRTCGTRTAHVDLPAVRHSIGD